MDQSDSKSEIGAARSAKPHGFKNNGGMHKKPQFTEKEFCRGLGFCICREGPEL